MTQDQSDYGGEPETDGGDHLPADPSSEPKPWEFEHVTPAESLERTADGIAAFRRLLTEIAKAIGVFALIFMAMILMVVSWEFMLFVIEFL